MSGVAARRGRGNSPIRPGGGHRVTHLARGGIDNVARQRQVVAAWVTTASATTSCSTNVSLDRRPLTPLGRLLLTLAAAVIVLAGIRAASPVIGPVVIALMLTIAWSPGASWLEKHGFPSSLAALTGIVLGVVFVVLFAILVWSSLGQLQDKLPEYQPRVGAIRESIVQLLAKLPFETPDILSSEALQPGAIMGYAVGLIRNLTSAAGAVGGLVLIMAFMMIEAVRYPEKLLDALSSSGAVSEPLARFGESMRSYVLINFVFGLIQAVLNTALLLALGVDFAILWGLVSFVLSFLPNVGFILALVPPALLALLQFGFGRAIGVVVGFAVVNVIVDTLIKPRFVGESLDLSPAVVLLSLIFWSWMLGPSGALLAVPLSLAMKFLFESFDETQWIAHLMSDAKPARRTDLVPVPAE